MIKSYLLVTFRGLIRNKAFSFINIVGLAFGISCSLIIFLWVRDELTTDGFHKKNDRLYRVLENQTYSAGQLFTFNSTPGPMAPVLKERFPEIEMATRITWPERRLFQIGEKNFYEEGRFVDQDFTLMHTFPLIKGDINSCLKDNHAIVISQAMAKKFFGDDDPLGKALVMDAGESFSVTGVLKDIPGTSSIQFDFLMSFEWFFNKNKDWLASWGNNNIRTNILLRDKTDPVLLAEKLKHEINNHTEESKNIELIIQPLKDAYLYGKFENGKLAGGRIESVRIFFVVAILVLLIASINFMNLTTAQSAKRAKEVGLRKTVGAVKRQLAFQFLAESMVMVIFSSLLAILITYLMLPLFNEIAGKKLTLDLFAGQPMVIFISVIVFTGLVSGSYPALYISGFNPARVLKGQIKSGTGASRFRKVLVVTQFCFSIILIISTIVVFRQLNFIKSKDIGMDRKNLTYMCMRGDMQKHGDAIREELLKDPSVEIASLSSANPIDFGNSTSGLEWEGKDPNQRTLFSNFSVDYNFIQSLGMTMKLGRSFKQELTTDTANFIVNEAAAKAMGFENPVDQPLTLWKNRKGKIIGMVKDFHFQSVHDKVEPLFMLYDPDWFNIIFVRHKEGQLSGALKAMEKVSKQYAASYPFESNLLDQDWDNLYKTEDRFGKLFNYFSGLSIIISCLGLFGLSAFSAEQRTKELGVRKVMGASVPGLMQLMAKEFALLVLIATVIGCPVGWYFMDHWFLKTYAYHVEVGTITLIIAAVLCFLVSMLTVSYHAAKAALVNPIKSLRYE